MLTSSCLTYFDANGELNADLFRSSADCIKILDLDGRICLLNPGGVATLELGDADELLGQTWWNVWPDDSRRHALSAFRAAKDGKVSSFQAYCPTAKGTARWWDVVASPVMDTSGTLTEVMVVSRDVSELYLARQALHQADQRKDELLATVAHELRNPLAAASGASELLKLKVLDHHRVIDIANLVQRQLSHMARIIEDLLDSSRISRGEISLSAECLDANALMADAHEQLRAAAKAKGQNLTVNFSSAPCIVKGDRTRLLQVVGNLLGNSVRYTPVGGDISLSLKHDGKWATLSVEDTGIGISPEKMSSIFDVYTQVDKSGTDKNSGLGLGLSLVLAFVNLHGGTVSATSRGVNLGSEFAVTLPLAVEL